MTEDQEKNGFNLSVTEGSDCRRTISVEIPRERFESEKEKVLKAFSKKAVLPGFRKGKAPREVVRSQFADDIHSEALKSLLPDAYAKAVSREKLQPIGDPVFRDVDENEDKSLTFSIDVEVEPVIELSGYRDLKVKMEEVSVDDEEVEKVIENLREREAQYEPVERGAVTSDIVVLDYVPLDAGGEPDEEKRVSDYPVQLGSGQLFLAFEEAIAGKNPGESGRAVIEYPEDYKPEHLAGQRVEYVFTVKEVREKSLLPLGDEFARKVDENLGSVDELKADISKKLLQEKENDARRKMEEDAIDRLIEENQFEVPGSMIERYRGEIEKEDARRRQMAGMGPEEDEEKKKEIDSIFDRVARRSIKRYFLIDRIARLEDIKVTNEDMDSEIGKIAEGSGRPLEEVSKYFAQGSEGRNNLRGRIKERKVFSIILGTRNEKKGEETDG
jgi:trigger factor